MVKKNTKKAVSKAPSTVEDLKTAVILVSVTLNVAIFVGWLAIKITTDYDAQVYSLLFSR